MRVFVAWNLTAAAVAAVLSLSAAGCDDPGVGRKCLYAGATNTDAGVAGMQISSPSLECMSRLCYLQAGENGTSDRSYCTANCTSDSDCTGGLTTDSNAKGLCPKSAGFVCAIPSSVGAFACQRLCICKDDLVSGMSQD